MFWKSFMLEHFWFFMFIDKKYVFWLFLGPFDNFNQDCRGDHYLCLDYDNVLR